MAAKNAKTNEPKKKQPEKAESRSLKVVTKIQSGYNYGDKVK